MRAEGIPLLPQTLTINVSKEKSSEGVASLASIIIILAFCRSLSLSLPSARLSSVRQVNRAVYLRRRVVSLTILVAEKERQNIRNKQYLSVDKIHNTERAARRPDREETQEF